MVEEANNMASMTAVYFPAVVSSSSIYAQAQALEQEAAQLKAKAQQMRINTNIARRSEPSIVAFDDSFGDSPWQSPCGTPRRFDSILSDASTEDECAQAPRTQIAQPAKTAPAQYWQTAPIHCVGNNVIAAAVPLQTVACFVAPCPQASWSSSSVQAACAPVQRKAGVQTTLMLRNLPNDYTRDMVLDIIDAEGFHGTYDFFYLPIDFQTYSGLGYAFINFATGAQAEHAMALLDGFCDWTVPSHKVLEVTWSELSQGLEANIERYRNSSMLHPSVPEDFKPLLFSQGARVSFPAPTKPIRQPRLKIMETAVKPIVDMPLRLTPWERINRTIGILNSGNIAEIVANARNTLCSKLDFIVPEVASNIHSVGGVCSFHRRLHDAIPDLKVSLDDVAKKEDGIVWRATCTGTQLKKFIPGLPIDAQAKFTLEVTVKDSTSGRPMWLCWKFIVESEFSVEMASLDSVEDRQLNEKEMLHRSGDCQPCAYFAFRADGCRQGDDCEFCHLCTKSQAKSKKKQKAQRLKAEAGLEIIDVTA